MFTKIRAKNFFSWATLEFDFQTGITLITGDNLDDNTSEGAGKSSIPNALCWCLYGQVPKDVNIDDVIRTGQKSCIVEVELEDGTAIIRSRKPNQLFIQCGQSVETGKDVRETQKLINDIIGMGFDTFCQSVYFAQNYSNKFITATQENKAKILSELQDLSIFDRASKLAAETAKEIKTILLMQLIQTKAFIDNDLIRSKNELKTFQQLNQNYETDKLHQLDEIIGRSYNIELKIKELEIVIQSLSNLYSLPDKLEELKKTNTQLMECQSQLYHINVLKTQKEQAIANKNCPTCGQSLPNSVCQDLGIPDDTELKAKAKSLQEELNRVNVEASDLTNKKNQNTLLQEKLQSLQEQKSQIVKDIYRIEHIENPYEDKIEELTNHIQELTIQSDNQILAINEQTQLQNRYEYLKNGFKEIKSHVFQSLLMDLNRNTNRYLRELFEVSANITFDNISDDGEISKIQTKVMLDGYERSLGLLSGGQFRRVQLAVDFALSDIVAQRSKNPINIRILDEAFKDLSEVSMEHVINVLQRMKGSTILIEHNSIIKNIVNRTYHVKLQNGTSIHE